MKLIKNINQYLDHYNESDLKKVLVIYGKKIGKEVVLYAMIIYTLIRDNQVPLKVRMILIAALGYLILPTDLVSDLLPIIGFTDDIAFLTYVISISSDYITPEVRQKAKDSMGNWINMDVEDAEILDEDTT